MLVDVLIASALSIAMALGVASLVEDTLALNTALGEVVQQRTALVSLEGYWRLAKMRGVAPSDDRQIDCEGEMPSWALPWCQANAALLAGSLVCLSSDGLDVHAKLVTQASGCADARP